MIPPLLATVLLDPPTTLVAGAVCALISLKLVRRGGLPEVWRAALLATGFSALYSLVVGWMFFFRPDWMFVYLVDTSKLPLVPLYVAFFFICSLGGLVGALAVGLLFHLGKPALAWAAAASLVASLLFVMLITGDQYGKVGTTRQYLDGTAVKLLDDATMMTAMNAVTAVLVVGGATLIALQVRRTVKGARGG